MRRAMMAAMTGLSTTPTMRSVIINMEAHASGFIERMVSMVAFASASDRWYTSYITGW